MLKNGIKNTIKLDYYSKPIEFQQSAKEALAYYLCTDKIDFRSVFDANLLPFEHLQNPKDFFIWIWEVLFEGEIPFVNNPSEYKEVKDIYEPLRIIGNKPTDWVP